MFPTACLKHAGSRGELDRHPAACSHHWESANAQDEAGLHNPARDFRISLSLAVTSLLLAVFHMLQQLQRLSFTSHS